MKAEYKFSVSSVIENLPDGDTEETSVEATGTIAEADSALTLSYSETGEGGKVDTSVKISGDCVTVVRHGAIDSRLVFREGVTESSLYSVGPYSFDASVKTRRIRNELTGDGGRLTLFYTMTVGGAEKRVRMRIIAEKA